MAVVLMIIGLIVGGVLVGRDLIGAAAVRAQISQVEKFNTAAATFQGKYAALPGDITAVAAAQFGFTARAGTLGRGDGNGELDGWGNGTQGFSWNQDGENLFFWEDLSSAHLIDQNFSTYVDGTEPTCTFGSSCAQYFPYAKIGGGNVVYTYSGYAANWCANTSTGPNFFGISITEIGASANVSTYYGGSSTPGLTVAQAYAIDKKIDDGMPTTGRVLAQYLANSPSGVQAWSPNSTAPSATTCYDTSTGVAAYSLTYNNGNGVNCALSFQMQAGD